MSTKEIESYWRTDDYVIWSVSPNFLNYGGLSGVILVSVLNDEKFMDPVPEEKIIQEGDLVKIDAGLIYKGYHF